MVKGELSNATAGLGRRRLHPGAGHVAAGAVRGEVLRRRPGHLANRTHALAQQIVVGLYPAQLTTQATVDRTDEFLASLPEDSAALRRMMLENRDGVARALRARAVDARA